MNATCSHQAAHRAASQQHPRPQQQPQRVLHGSVTPSAQGRRQLLAGLGAAALALGTRPAAATGLESIDLPVPDVSEAVAALKARNQQVLDDADASFQNSDLLRTLKERSEANRAGRKKELEDLYCRRQAELGVGDCGGLRFIPGMTKSGVQKRPEWMNSLLGLPEQQ